MNCGEARELFSDRADAQLTAEQDVTLARHLEGCADCRREWERFERTVGLLHSLEEARAPQGFAHRVIEAAGREPWYRRALRGIFLPFHVKLPLEAAAIVLVSTLVVLLYRQSPELQRALEAPSVPDVTLHTFEAPRKSAELEQAARERKARPGEYRAAREPTRPKDRLGRKEKSAPAEPPAVGGRLDVAEEGKRSPAPAAEPGLAAQARAPFHVIGRLRPRSPETIERELSDLLGKVGAVQSREDDRIGLGGTVELVVARDAYPRLVEGLRRMGEFTVETRASALPEQVRIAIRIAR